MCSQTILHSLGKIFGSIPQTIYENVRYFSYDDQNDYFYCAPCGKTIQKGINSQATTKNFDKHLRTHAHRTYTGQISDVDLQYYLTETFAGKIPQLVLNNLEFIEVSGHSYKCIKCEKKIPVSSSASTMENNFSYHLISFAHEENLEKHSELLNELQDIYGSIPALILNHSKFLRENENDKEFLCVICKKRIMVHPTDKEKTLNTFEQHLHSLNHMKNANVEEAFSILPELIPYFTCLPNYMLSNIEYISVNGKMFYCFLCHENIKVNHCDPYETEQNFQYHISSDNHEDRLSSRRNPENEVFNLLHSLFESSDVDVLLGNLKFLGFDDGGFYCSLCNEIIVSEGENNEDETYDELIDHFQSENHLTNVDYSEQVASEVMVSLKELYGGIPESILDNICYIRFKGGIDFECTLCNKIMQSKDNQDYESNCSVTKENFEKHLNSNKHQEVLNSLDQEDEDFQTELDDLFSPVPQFIENNRDHLGLKEDSDDFYCYLCDKTIAVVAGSKEKELTEQNFRTHLLSVGHNAKLKHKANEEMEVTEQLESIFNKIPLFILNNIEHIERQKDHFYCSLCDSRLYEGNFRQHLFAAQHKESIKQAAKDNEEALLKLNWQFWQIPDFLLKNIDFLCTYDEDDCKQSLFCVLCQEVLPIDEDDLTYTTNTLQCHMDSHRHQSNLKSI